jgi:hypothetical protein
VRTATLLILASAAAAAEPAKLPDLPVKGRPAHFDEERSPIGSFRAPVVKAEPTELQAEDPLTLTLRISARGPVLRPPLRPNLEDFPGFKEDFEIEPVGTGDGRIDKETWEFAYRLRPRRADVKMIPSIPFVFFVPGLLPAHRGYQTHHTSAVELTVKPRAEVPPSAVEGPRPPRGPDALYEIVEGAEVLRDQRPGRLPSLPVMVLFALAPPLWCFAWYRLWRQLYPDAARLNRLRRSRAARLAIQSLHRLGAGEASARAEQVGAAVGNYLRQRFDLPAAEPTPDEVQAHLQQAGVTAAQAERTAEFFRSCDAVRFGPPFSADGLELVAEAEQLILALEAPADSGERAKAATAGALAMVCLLTLVSPAGAIRLGTPEDCLAWGRGLFHEGLRLRDDSPQEARRQFGLAAQFYEELLTWHYRNPALCRNAGNAWLLGGNVARAIYAYRCGLQLAPNDRALRECLAYAREQVVHSSPGNFGQPPVEHRPPWLPRFGVTWLLGLTFGAYVVGCIAFTRWLMTRRGGLLLVAGGALAVALLAGTALAFEEWERRQEERYPLVVVAEDGTLLYKGNGLSYPRYETPLNAGVEARLLFARGDWLQIELSGGEVGWVPRKYTLVDGAASVPDLL